MMLCNCFAIGDKEIRQVVGEKYQGIFITDIDATAHQILKEMLLEGKANRTKKGMCPQCDCLNLIRAAIVREIHAHNAQFVEKKAA